MVATGLMCVACCMQATGATEGDLAAGKVPDSIRDLQTAIDGMRTVMSIHALWMLASMDKIVECVNSGIPEDYETAISSHKEQIIWSVIQMDIHNHVCDLITIESHFCHCLSLLWDASLLDDACQGKRQALQRDLTMHMLYTSSVSAVDTILHKLMPLRTSRARQDKFETCP